MKDKGLSLAIALLLPLAVLLLLIPGCAPSTKPSVAKPPIEMWTGKAGIQPEEVWQSYDWVITSKDHYTRTCK